MQEAFHIAFFPPGLRLLGRTLRPLTLWHLAALEALHSPFLSPDPGAQVRPGDLLLALRVCAHAPLSPLRLRPSVKDLWYRLRYRRGQAWQRHARTFVAWLQLSRTLPEMWATEPGEGETAPRGISAPPTLSRVTALMESGLTWSEAWAVSPGLADWIIGARAERHQPAVRFVTDEERADMEAEAEEDAQAEPMSEAEIIALAKARLSPDQFQAWHTARKAKP